MNHLNIHLKLVCVLYFYVISDSHRDKFGKDRNPDFTVFVLFILFSKC